MRLACLLQLVVLALSLALVARTNALTATVLMFVGAPSIVLGLALYAWTLYRATARGAAAPPLSSPTRGGTP